MNIRILILALALTLPSMAMAADAQHPSAEEAAAHEEAAAPAAEAVTAPAEEHAAEAAHPAAAHAAPELNHQHWHFSGLTGTYDRAALQRGYKVYREVCAACHSMKRVYFRNLDGIGYNEGQIKNIAAEYSVEDGPNDEGDMFTRAARPSDHFPSPFLNDNAAKYANNGALPPDLSLIIKARHHGPDYVYSLLTGYDAAPAGTTLLEGQHWNKTMPGHVIAMAPPLSDGMIAYEDETPATREQYAKDVVEFLTWAGDPYMEKRKRTGIKAILFLAVFASIMYAYKRRIWAKVH